MKVSDSEGLPNHTGPESCVLVGDGCGEALTGERAGRVWSPEIKVLAMCLPIPSKRDLAESGVAWVLPVFRGTAEQ